MRLGKLILIILFVSCRDTSVSSRDGDVEIDTARSSEVSLNEGSSIQCNSPYIDSLERTYEFGDSIGVMLCELFRAGWQLENIRQVDSDIDKHTIFSVSKYAKCEPNLLLDMRRYLVISLDNLDNDSDSSLEYKSNTFNKEHYDHRIVLQIWFFQNDSLASNCYDKNRAVINRELFPVSYGFTMGDKIIYMESGSQQKTKLLTEIFEFSNRHSY